MLGQQYGFPVPIGGAGQLTAALVRRLESRGGRVYCDASAERVVVRDGRAIGVQVRGGERIAASRAVLADVVAPNLYGALVGWEHLPARFHDDINRFQWDFATVKVDWALSGPVPWIAPEAALAGTVHLSGDMDEMTAYCSQIAMGQVPSVPFVLAGQMTTADVLRSPPGTESLWGYTHVPREVRGDPGGEGLSGEWNARELEAVAARIERQIERFAPGFSERISNRHIMGPRQLEEHNSNLVGGAINGGTSAVHQQLLFRPTPGLGRAETPIRSLYLASSSAHPGGGVHGACGANAARAALHQNHRSGELLGAKWLSVAQRGLSGRPAVSK